MPRAFLTGASGFIGGALLVELLRRGWDVRALLRPGSDPRNLQGHEHPVERFEGDLRDLSSLERGLAGCDVLFHVAARYSLWNPRPREIYADNVDGTRNILEAARRRGVEKVVYTSTVGTIHIPQGDQPGDESRLATLEEIRGHYKRSKLLAEMEARKYAAEGLPVVIVHPSAPVGPFDVKPTPTGQMVLDFLLGRMVGYSDTGLNVVGVEDVAVGHLLALDRGRPGESYILGGENMSFLEILKALSAVSGIPVPRVKVPLGVLAPVALACECWSRISRKPPRVSWEAVRLAGHYMYFSSAKAAAELGYRPGLAAPALERAVRWFEKMVPPGRKLAAPVVAKSS
jgi:dihydroflavonol-4-reductase